MPANVVEMITPQRWSLLGSVVAPAHTLRKSKSLQFVHPIGILSSAIWSAMLKKLILPKVVISSSSSKITLVNGKIVGVRNYHGPTKPNRLLQVSCELEEISFVFESVVVENIEASTSAADELTTNYP